MSGVGLLICKIGAPLAFSGMVMLLSSASRPRLERAAYRVLAVAGVLGVAGLTLLLWSLGVEESK